MTDKRPGVGPTVAERLFKRDVKVIRDVLGTHHRETIADVVHRLVSEEMARRSPAHAEIGDKTEGATA